MHVTSRGPFGARIHMVSAIAIPALGVPELGVAMSGSIVDGMMADNLHGLEALIERYKHRGAFGKPILKSGDPVDIINETAKEVGADLIVMTTHGRTGVARLAVGKRRGVGGADLARSGSDDSRRRQRRAGGVT